LITLKKAVVTHSKLVHFKDELNDLFSSIDDMIRNPRDLNLESVIHLTKIRNSIHESIQKIEFSEKEMLIFKDYLMKKEDEHRNKI